jgi:hypothetical protein
MAMPGLTVIAVTIIMAWRGRKKLQTSEENKKLNIFVDMASKRNDLHQQRMDLRNDLQRIHPMNLSLAGLTPSPVPKPRHMISVLAKSTEQALQMLNQKGATIKEIYLNIDQDSHNGIKPTQSFAFRIDFDIFENYERVVYFYNPPKNGHYVKIKMIQEFKKLKELHPSCKFTISNRNIRSKETIV